MLAIIRHEYDVENDRKQILDTKASTFITVNIALLTIFIPLIPFSEMADSFSGIGTNVRNCLVVIFVCLGISIFLLLISFVLLVYVAGISGYSRVQLDSILNLAESIEKIEDSSMKKALVEHYHQILRGTIDDKGNITINTNRANKMQLGIILTVIGYVGLFITTVLLRIIIR